MAFRPQRRVTEEEIITPKQREALAKRKEELMGEINKLLDQMPESEAKAELTAKRDHCLAKFPVFPVDLSIWIIAYQEDWFRDHNRAIAALAA